MPAVSDERQLGCALRYAFRWDDVAAIAREAESNGYRALFLPETGGRDILVTLGALAGETHGLLLGTGILPMAARTGRLTAMGAATVQERSGGRLVLGLGTGPAVPGALDRLRELVVTVRRLLDGETIEDSRHALPTSLVPSRPPIWISALGPNAVRTAGAIADGVLLNWCTPERVVRARAELAMGAQAAGRDPAAVTVAVYVRACMDADPRAAARALRSAAGEYASFPAYARQFRCMGLGVEAGAAGAAHAAGRLQDVPDALVRAVCLSGETDAARTRLDDYREAGADLPIVYPVATDADPVGSVTGTLRALSPR